MERNTNKILSTKEVTLKIKEIIEKNNEEKDSESIIEIIKNFTSNRLSQEIKLSKITSGIKKIIMDNNIKDDHALVFNIINTFVQTYSLFKKDKNDQVERLSKAASEIRDIIITDNYIKKDSKLISSIIEGLTKACLYIEESELLIIMLDIIIGKDDIKKDSKLVFDITSGFLRAYFVHNKDLSKVASKIKEIINDKIIQKRPKLLFNVVKIFVDHCLYIEKKIQNTALEFKNISNSMNESMPGTNRDIIKPIFISIISKYLYDILLHNKEYDNETEKLLLEIYNETFSKAHTNLKDISLSEFSILNNVYLKNRFDTIGIDGGCKYELFLKTVCELFDPEYSGKIKLSEILKKENKKIFKNFKFISLKNKSYNKKEFFEKIGLKPEDFCKNYSNNYRDNDNFTVIHCIYLEHAFIAVVDRRESFENAKINLIDSSMAIKYKLKSRQEDNLFIKDSFLNKYIYQENGTCWINAMSAFFILLQKQKENKDFSINDIEKGFTIYRESGLSELESEIIVRSSVFYKLMHQEQFDLYNFFVNNNESNYLTQNISFPVSSIRSVSLQLPKNEVKIVDSELLQRSHNFLMNKKIFEERAKRISLRRQSLSNNINSKKPPIKETAVIKRTEGKGTYDMNFFK